MYFVRFMRVLQSLPFTAYIKMVDIWILSMMLYPFLAVILLTVKENVETMEDNAKPVCGKWVTKQKWSTRVSTCLNNWVLISALSIFIIFYWTAGIINLTFPTVSRACKDP